MIAMTGWRVCERLLEMSFRTAPTIARVRERVWKSGRQVHLLWLPGWGIASRQAAITVGVWDLCHCLAHPDRRWMEVGARQAGEPIAPDCEVVR